MRERVAQAGDRPEDREEKRKSVRAPEVLVLLAGDAGEVPDGRRHRANELAFGRTPDRVFVLLSGLEAGDDAEEEEGAETSTAAREQRARDLDDREDPEDRRDQRRHRGRPAKAGGEVARVEEAAQVLEQVEDP